MLFADLKSRIEQQQKVDQELDQELNERMKNYAWVSTVQVVYSLLKAMISSHKTT